MDFDNYTQPGIWTQILDSTRLVASYEGVLSVVMHAPPHNRLLNKGRHSFPLLSQSQFTYQNLEG